MAYSKYKDSTKRTGSNNVLRYKAFKTASNPKYNRYEKGLVSMVYKILIKNLQPVILNQQLPKWTS